MKVPAIYTAQWALVTVLSTLRGIRCLTGPASPVPVRSRESLTVRCSYQTGFESHKKYWCKGGFWKNCDIVITTSGTEGDTTSGRFTIRDEQTQRTFSVTMTGVTQEDEDTYFCGVERFWTADDMYEIKVTVLPGVCRREAPWTDVLDFPETFQELSVGESIGVSCREQYEKKTLMLQCKEEAGNIHFFPRDLLTSCKEKCRRVGILSPNITLFPDQEYYGPGEEVTVRCPEGSEPNVRVLQCVPEATGNRWNTTRVFCSQTSFTLGPSHVINQTEIHPWDPWDLYMGPTFGLVIPISLKLLGLLSFLCWKGISTLSGKYCKSSKAPTEPHTEPHAISGCKESNVYHQDDKRENKRIFSEREEELYENLHHCIPGK
ncbi:CMRF35-like molecule 5 isoform X1 [Xenopus tropicalis]|uniref:CMRF35-like molecule 5 n=1 Tax=Xenopus tropicalis TaxID=8364 RepID=A0A803JK01_XENTR|nr:CMRF35-like molecule 5 isoform X1 [Xenopus tropicalis]